MKRPGKFGPRSKPLGSRTSTLTRTATLRRSGRIAASNPARKQSEFARCYGSRARVAFVRGLACSVFGCLQGPSENAHVVRINGGAGRKSDAEAIAPACRNHHRELHRIGAASFETRYRCSLAAWAAATVAAWDAECARAAGATVTGRIAA